MFKLPRSVDYSLLILLCLRELADCERLCAPEVARRCGLPGPQVAKLLKQLQRAGWVMSVRGANGGYRLTATAHGVSLSDIYCELEGPIQVADCLVSEPCDCGALRKCRLRPHLELLNRTMAAAMAGITLAQLAEPAWSLAVEGGGVRV